GVQALDHEVRPPEICSYGFLVSLWKQLCSGLLPFPWHISNIPNTKIESTYEISTRLSVFSPSIRFLTKVWHPNVYELQMQQPYETL
ncbi:hypothetical protein L9F63_001457, partial [Diploptera punctata]